MLQFVKVIEQSGENEGFCISIESLPTYRGGQYWLGEMKIVSGIVQMLDRINNEFARSLISLGVCQLQLGGGPHKHCQFDPVGKIWWMKIPPRIHSLLQAGENYLFKIKFYKI